MREPRRAPRARRPAGRSDRAEGLEILRPAAHGRFGQRHFVEPEVLVGVIEKIAGV